MNLYSSAREVAQAQMPLFESQVACYFEPLLPATPEWYRNLACGAFIQTETQLIRQLLPKFFGYHLLMLGNCLSQDSLLASPIHHQMMLLEKAETSVFGLSALANYQALPFQTDTLDVVILAHVLEFNAQPEKILEEACRVLIPQGRLIVMGFNACSFMGLWRYLLVRQQTTIPWQGRYLLPRRIKQLTELHGIVETDRHYYAYRPPLENQKVWDRLSFLERLGAWIFPKMGSGYCWVGQKRVATLTPIKPRWRARRLFLHRKRLAEQRMGRH